MVANQGTLALVVCASIVGSSHAANDPFASSALDYSPAPGQFVQDDTFSDPFRALGSPVGGGTTAADNSSQVTLGGFGGSITLAFDHTVMDDPANPWGMDCIVFGNAFWPGGDPNRHWAECAVIEISLDENGNGLADDSWYLIPGTHLSDVQGNLLCIEWDDDTGNATKPPANQSWIPVEMTGTWETCSYELPQSVFAGPVVQNPLSESDVEGIYGYGDYTPTLVLGDLDQDDTIDDLQLSPGEFYTVPDNPYQIGISPGSGGGDAFDIAWAIDPATGLPAELSGFDFLRLTTAIDRLNGPLGEISTEVDAAADAAPGMMFDADFDWDVDLTDYSAFTRCRSGVEPWPRGCRTMDFDGDGDLSLSDWGAFQSAFTGEP